MQSQAKDQRQHFACCLGNPPVFSYTVEPLHSDHLGESCRSGRDVAIMGKYGFNNYDT